MNLSERAKRFLSKLQYRKDAVKSLDFIYNAFNKIGLQPTQALIDFQLRYGGLIIPAHHEPICFGILHGSESRGEFSYPIKILNNLIHNPPEEDIDVDHFCCADTKFQKYFTLDLDGNYYENWNLVATNFVFVIEDLAVYDEVYKMGYTFSTSEYFENIAIDFEQIKIDLAMNNYPKFLNDIIKWGQNHACSLRVSNDTIKLFCKNDITDEQKNFLKSLTYTYKK